MITKEMRLYEILDMDDRICEILMNHGLNCGGCPGAESETLEEAAKGHNVDCVKLIEDLNALFSK